MHDYVLDVIHKNLEKAAGKEETKTPHSEDVYLIAKSAIVFVGFYLTRISRQNEQQQREKKNSKRSAQLFIDGSVRPSSQSDESNRTAGDFKELLQRIECL